MQVRRGWTRYRRRGVHPLSPRWQESQRGLTCFGSRRLCDRGCDFWSRSFDCGGGIGGRLRSLFFTLLFLLLFFFFTIVRGYSFLFLLGLFRRNNNRIIFVLRHGILHSLG